MNMIELAEMRVIPDPLIRFGIRRLCQRRLYDEHYYDPDQQGVRYEVLLKQLRASAVALETQAANEQHYEVPTEFFSYVLGSHMKYSACYWAEDTDTLDQAEANMLALYCERADLVDGQSVLELGCGWGSLSLWMAEHFPKSQFTAVSNSATQKQYIESQASLRNIRNLDVITCDVNSLDLSETFDRVVSVEMFEHVRNYQALMQRINQWLKPEGKLFIHIFCHRYLMYPFETARDDDWMGRYFFTGGLMPATDTLLRFQENLKSSQVWTVNGKHYQKTAEAWLNNLDDYSGEALNVFLQHYDRREAKRWVQRWRMFFMSCAELFGYSNGREWMVSHYLFEKPQ